MAHDVAVSAAEYRALSEFRYQIRRLLHFSEQAAHDAGLEPHQHQLLLAIKGLPAGREPSIGELAERLQVQHHSTVELVDRLEARGLVRRSRGEADRRQVFVHLTASGEAALEELSRYHRAELRSVGPEMVRALEALMARAGVANAGIDGMTGGLVGP